MAVSQVVIKQTPEKKYLVKSLIKKGSTGLSGSTICELDSAYPLPALGADGEVVLDNLHNFNTTPPRVGDLVLHDGVVDRITIAVITGIQDGTGRANVRTVIDFAVHTNWGKISGSVQDQQDLIAYLNGQFTNALKNTFWDKNKIGNSILTDANSSASGAGAVLNISGKDLGTGAPINAGFQLLPGNNIMFTTAPGGQGVIISAIGGGSGETGAFNHEDFYMDATNGLTELLPNKYSESFQIDSNSRDQIYSVGGVEIQPPKSVRLDSYDLGISMPYMGVYIKGAELDTITGVRITKPNGTVITLDNTHFSASKTEMLIWDDLANKTFLNGTRVDVLFPDQLTAIYITIHYPKPNPTEIRRNHIVGNYFYNVEAVRVNDKTAVFSMVSGTDIQLAAEPPLGAEVTVITDAGFGTLLIQGDKPTIEQFVQDGEDNTFIIGSMWNISSVKLNDEEVEFEQVDTRTIKLTRIIEPGTTVTVSNPVGGDSVVFTGYSNATNITYVGIDPFNKKAYLYGRNLFAIKKVSFNNEQQQFISNAEGSIITVSNFTYNTEDNILVEGFNTNNKLVVNYVWSKPGDPIPVSVSANSAVGSTYTISGSNFRVYSKEDLQVHINAQTGTIITHDDETITAEFPSSLVSPLNVIVTTPWGEGETTGLVLKSPWILRGDYNRGVVTLFGSGLYTVNHVRIPAESDEDIPFVYDPETTNITLNKVLSEPTDVLVYDENNDPIDHILIPVNATPPVGCFQIRVNTNRIRIPQKLSAVHELNIFWGDGSYSRITSEDVLKTRPVGWENQQFQFTGSQPWDEFDPVALKSEGYPIEIDHTYRMKGEYVISIWGKSYSTIDGDFGIGFDAYTSVMEDYKEDREAIIGVSGELSTVYNPARSIYHFLQFSFANCPNLSTIGLSYNYEPNVNSAQIRQTFMRGTFYNCKIATADLSNVYFEVSETTQNTVPDCFEYTFTDNPLTSVTLSERLKPVLTWLIKQAYTAAQPARTFRSTFSLSSPKTSGYAGDAFKYTDGTNIYGIGNPVYNTYAFLNRKYLSFYDTIDKHWTEGA